MQNSETVRGSYQSMPATFSDFTIDQGCTATGKSARGKLLQQLKDLGLKHCTTIGSAPNRKGIGYYTHLAPKDGDFDPYVSPVFGGTEYESLKEAIAIEAQIHEYMTGWDKLPFACPIPTETCDRVKTKEKTMREFTTNLGRSIVLEEDFTINQGCTFAGKSKVQETANSIVADYQNPLRAIAEFVGNEDECLMVNSQVAWDLFGLDERLTVIDWDFSKNPSIGAFASRLCMGLMGAQEAFCDITDPLHKFYLAYEALKDRKAPCVILLDGLQSVQFTEGDDCGLLKDSVFRDWLRKIAKLETKAFVVIASAVPVLDLVDLTSFSRYQAAR